MTESPVFLRRTGPHRPILVLVALAGLLAFSLAAAGPGAAHAHAQQQDPGRANAGGGGGAGWDTLISTLQSLVPVAGAIGLLVGIGIWGLAGPNSAQKAVGVGVIGTAALGLVIGSFAADLAAMFTQFI